MSENTKYRVWQIHLSTAILAMLCVGWISMMNAHPPPPVGTRESYESEFKFELTRVRYAVALEQPHYGWPVVCYQPNELWIKYPQEEEGEERPLLWDAHGFIVDCCIAIGCLIAVVVASEFIIRRRGAKIHAA